jgi:hypothetical protein
MSRLRSFLGRSIIFGVLAGSLLAPAAASPIYFLNTFDQPVLVGPTPAPGIWFTDRYAPGAFDQYWFQGDNRLRIGIRTADEASQRPPGFQAGFYNTQSRQFILDNGLYTSIRGRIFIGPDWQTHARRSDLWGVARNADGGLSGYPILGFVNIPGVVGLRCQYFTQDVDQDPRNGFEPGWVDVSDRVPGGVTINRWYDLEIVLTPSSFNVYVDGALVFVDDDVIGSVRFTGMILQAFNFPIAGDTPTIGPPIPPNLHTEYDVFWDDVGALPAGGHGLPVDLNRTYFSPSGGPLAVPGIALATTRPGGGLGGEQVIEFSRAPATDGTFTPFSDAHKPPKTLATDLRGRGYSFVLDVHDQALWAGGPIWSTRDNFAVKAGSDVDSRDGRPAVGVIVTKADEGRLRIHAASSFAHLGDFYLTNANETRFVIGVRFAADNSTMTVDVTPINGTNAGVTDSLTPLPLTVGGTDPLLNDDVSAIGFCAGWVSYAERSTAKATITNFVTDAVPNVMYAFSEDPYARPGERFSVMTGFANLAQPITGYQAFLHATGLVTLNPTSDYNRGFFDTFVPGTIDATLDLAGASPVATVLNMDFADIVLDAVSPGGNSIGFEPNVDTRVNLFAGAGPGFPDVPALTLDSNVLLVDGAPPSLTAPVLSGTALFGANTLVQGTLNVSVEAVDGAVNDSGLADRPEGWITWHGGAVTPLRFHSWIGHEFLASLPIGPATPLGPATLWVRVVDDAGNFNVRTVGLNVNVAQLALTIEANHFGPALVAPVARIVDVVVGGTGGANPPVTLYTDLNNNLALDPGEEGLIAHFNVHGVATLHLTAAHGLPATNNLLAISVKDRFFSLRTLVRPAMPPDRGSFTTAGNGQYTGTVNLRMGDVTHNNIVNVADLAVWAWRNGLAHPSATDHATPLTPRNPEITGDGIVNLADRNVITAAWLRAGDATPGAFAPSIHRGQRGDRMRLRELVAEGLPKAAAESMDRNRDGWVTVDEINTWVRQRR